MRTSSLLLKRLLGVAALFAVLSASLVAAASSASVGKTATARCASSGLVVWLNTQGNGAAGSVYYEIEFTNLSGRACTLIGYPGVSAVNIEGRQIEAPASRESFQRPSSVVLKRGATAVAQLQIVEAGNFPPADCREVTAAGLRVYPPGQTASRVIPFPFQACSRSNRSILSVRAVQPDH